MAEGIVNVFGDSSERRLFQQARLFYDANRGVTEAANAIQRELDRQETLLRDMKVNRPELDKCVNSENRWRAFSMPNDDVLIVEWRSQTETAVHIIPLIK